MKLTTTTQRTDAFLSGWRNHRSEWRHGAATHHVLELHTHRLAAATPGTRRRPRRRRQRRRAFPATPADRTARRRCRQHQAIGVAPSRLCRTERSEVALDPPDGAAGIGGADDLDRSRRQPLPPDRSGLHDSRGARYGTGADEQRARWARSQTGTMNGRGPRESERPDLQAVRQYAPS